jgi:peroxiredoxin Q/BCP
VASEQKALTEGDLAPDFSLPSDLGETVSLKNFRGKRVVLYFYPKDNTPGCTREACDFRDLFPQVDRTKTVLLGVSMDPVATHRRFSEKHRLPFPLLSDEGGEVSKKYGVYKQKQLYGRKFWGIERSTFVIDPDGVIKKAFRKVRVDGHARDVLEALDPKASETRGAKRV